MLCEAMTCSIVPGMRQRAPEGHGDRSPPSTCPVAPTRWTEGLAQAGKLAFDSSSDSHYVERPRSGWKPQGVKRIEGCTTSLLA